MCVCVRVRACAVSVSAGRAQMQSSRNHTPQVMEHDPAFIKAVSSFVLSFLLGWPKSSFGFFHIVALGALRCL